jgi:hypothetical protein
MMEITGLKIKHHLSTAGYYFQYRQDRNDPLLIRASLFTTKYHPAGHDDVKNDDGHLRVDDVAVSPGYGMPAKSHTDVINYFESRILLGQIK